MFFFCGRLQNSPYFCVFRYVRAVKQKVWNEAERLLRHALPISLLILIKKKKKPIVLQSISVANLFVFEKLSRETKQEKGERMKAR